MSSEEDPVAWLRAQVEARLALARKAAGRTDGHWWRRMADAGHFDDSTLEPVGALYAGKPDLDIDGDVCGGEYVVVYDEGAPSDAQFDHIAANDPQDTIARCEAELATLDLLERVIREDSGKHAGCAAVDAWSALAVAKLALALLASGYRHRPGFPAAFAA